MTAERYECPACDGTGYKADAEGYVGDECATCDGLGVTAIDCPGCGRTEVPIAETTFVARHARTYCEGCGDAIVDRLEAQR